jgi:hypothetical protein
MLLLAFIVFGKALYNDWQQGTGSRQEGRTTTGQQAEGQKGRRAGGDDGRRRRDGYKGR